MTANIRHGEIEPVRIPSYSEILVQKLQGSMKLTSSKGKAQ
jgi:hypothetical protein